jgi:hypothetical protein
MKQGALLEKTLRIVQESLKDNVNTEIFSNYKIENSSGRKREFDIAIKTIVNGFELLVVVECKDYKTPVPIEKIESFHSKCLRIPTINKKIFVSRNGFQADAINAANDFGMECYDIENIDPYIVKSWYAISMITPVSRYIQIKETQLWTNPPITESDIKLESIIYHDRETEGSTIQEFIIGIIRQSGKHPEIFTNNILFTRENDIIDKSNSYSFELDNIEGLFLLDSEKKRYDVFKIFFIFDYVEKAVKAKVKVERIKSGSKEMSTIVTHEIEGDESIKLVLKDSDPNTFDPYIINERTGEIIDSGYTFAYQKKEDN